MKKKLWIGSLACVCLMAFAMAGGCTEQQRAKSWGGTATIDLPPGQKLVTVTWKGDEIWFLTRDMYEGERPEAYDFEESSSFGILEGKVVFQEHRKR